MVKLSVALLAIALAGTASAAGWRSLRIDASSEASFNQSVELFRDKLSPSRRHAFERSLQQIWLQGENEAAASQREYTQDDYFAQLDGLGYEEVVRVTDPTGEQAQKFRAEYYYARGPAPAPAPLSLDQPPAPKGWNGEQLRGGTALDRLPPAMRSLAGDN
jgi:hypothetical protein